MCGDITQEERKEINSLGLRKWLEIRVEKKKEAILLLHGQKHTHLSHSLRVPREHIPGLVLR